MKASTAAALGFVAAIVAVSVAGHLVDLEVEEDEEELDSGFIPTDEFITLSLLSARFGRYWELQMKYGEMEETALDAMHDAERALAGYWERFYAHNGWDPNHHFWDGPGERPPDADVPAVP